MDVLGASRRIDIPGVSKEKWSEDEGNEAIRLLEMLVRKKVNDPDTYFITPFRNVRAGFHELLLRRQDLLVELGIVDKAQREWGKHPKRNNPYVPGKRSREGYSFPIGGRQHAH